VKVLDTTFQKTYIVEVTTSASVAMSQLTVKGPSRPGGGNNCAPNPLSLDMGIAVVSNASLNLFNAAVRDIYDIDPFGSENSGCPRGDAISIGRPGGPGVPLTVGHAVIRQVLVDRYQKDGVTARTAGTTLDLRGSLVRNLPSAVIASNGVEVLDGARGSMYFKGVIGNQCNLQPGVVFGPDPINDTEASGILLFASDPKTFVSQTSCPRTTWASTPTTACSSAATR
jgi:hypothetical protein